MQLNRYLQYLIRTEAETENAGEGLKLIAQRKRERRDMYLRLVKKRVFEERGV